MRIKKFARASAACLAFAVSGAIAGPVTQNPEMMTNLGDIIQGWQQRILNENLPVVDAPNWALRNMARFSTLSEERMTLLGQATTLGEVELLISGAPIPDGTSLGLLMASKPGNVLLHGALAKRDINGAPLATPTSSPESYNELVFTALTPCRIYDSRVSQGGAGPWVSGVGRIIQVGPYPAGYVFQGGSATSCGLDALATAGQIAAIMAGVSTTGQTGTGYLTFFSSGASPYPYGVAQGFRQGLGTQTSFVVMPTDLISDVWSKGQANNANTEVIVDIVGYFAKVRSDMWAVVDGGTGGSPRAYRASSSARLGAGTYEVIFAQDVTACAYTATLGHVGVGGALSGSISLASRAGNANGVFVATYDAAGTATDRSFHLRVKCLN